MSGSEVTNPYLTLLSNLSTSETPQCLKISQAFELKAVQKVRRGPNSTTAVAEVARREGEDFVDAASYVSEMSHFSLEAEDSESGVCEALKHISRDTEVRVGEERRELRFATVAAGSGGAGR